MPNMGVLDWDSVWDFGRCMYLNRLSLQHLEGGIGGGQYGRVWSQRGLTLSILSYSSFLCSMKKASCAKKGLGRWLSGERAGLPCGPLC